MPGIAARLVEPEILDDLPATDPRAVASRRDLGRLNLLMLQDRIMAKMLTAYLPSPPRRILEIGCGDGSFMLAVARRLHRKWPSVELVLLDRQSLVTPDCIADFAAIGWKARVVESDIFDWGSFSAAGEHFDAVTANLFLHHFKDADLSRILAAMSAIAPVFLGTEPLRKPFPLLASRMLRVVGANEVTRHDAPASVRAGFAGKELSALWPAAKSTVMVEGRRGLFTHAFAAVAADRPG
jgi:SAM-dependent methyltransferase